MSSAAIWTDLELTILSEVVRQRKTNIISYHVNVESEKYELIYTTETDSDRKQIYGHQGERC